MVTNVPRATFACRVNSQCSGGRADGKNYMIYGFSSASVSAVALGVASVSVLAVAFDVAPASVSMLALDVACVGISSDIGIGITIG